MHYLKLPKILGTVTSKGHVGWIPLESMSFDERDEWGNPRQGLSGVGMRRLQHGDIHVSRRSDRSSKDIMFASLNGTRFADVKIELFAGEKGREATLFSFGDVLLSSFSMAGEGPNPRETFILDVKGIRVSAVS